VPGFCRSRSSCSQRTSPSDGFPEFLRFEPEPQVLLRVWGWPEELIEPPPDIQPPMTPPPKPVPPPGLNWTHTPPAGWVNDDSQVPGAGDPNTDGVTEWAGWSVVNKDWWVKVAEDQKRSEFVSGEGAVAVADPDEWDDMDHPEGLFNAFLSTPPINIAGADAGSLQLIFDSSWRQEASQTASVTVQYDGGDPVVVLLWPSEGDSPAAFKADATNEDVTVNLSNPAGAKTMVITFGLTDAGNNWWWAIDNIEVIGAFGK